MKYPASIHRALQALSVAAALAAAVNARAAVADPKADGAEILQNHLIRLEFSRSDGSLTQITDLKSGSAWLSSSAPHRLVKLIQRTPEKSSNILLSNDAGPPEIRREGDALTLRFPPLRDGRTDTGIRLTVTVRLAEDSPEARFSVQIDNGSPYPVEEVWFPFIGSRSAATGRHHDVFTTSHGFERDLYGRFDNGTFDTHGFGQHLQRIGLTSGQLLPMMDLSGPRGGISYIKYERRPRPTDFVYENLTGNPTAVELGWAWVTTTLLAPGRSFKSCEIGVGVHESDWHATADRLRAFMEPWWRPSKMAGALRERIGIYQVQIKGFNGEPYHDFDELPRMAADCGKYGVRDLLFWDCAVSVYVRPDAAADFWEMPREREQKLRSALTKVRRMGLEVSTCVNYRLINETSRAWKRVGSEAQSSFFGIPLYGNVPGSMNGGIYLNRSYEMGTRSVCQGTDRFQEFARGLTRQTLDLGLSSLFIDQAYESSYALPKGRGDLDPFAVMDRAYSWYDEAARMARARDPEAYTIGEVPDLWNTPLIDAWWVWGWERPDWPTLQLFQYVMPEACFVWCTDEFQRPYLAKAFGMGALLAIATHGITGLMSEEPDFAAQIGRLQKLRTETKAFVSRGRFVDKRGLRVDGGEAYVFQSAAGLAVTFANPSPGPAQVVVRLAPQDLTRRGLGPGQVHLEDGSVVPAAPAGHGNEWTLTLKLPGYAAAVWTIPYAN